MNLLTIPQAAEVLELSRQRVHKLVVDGRIKAQRVGTNYVIDKRELDKFSAIPRRSGREAKVA